MKTREPRITTLMPARLRTDDGWTDVTIRNLSSHGAMLQVRGAAPARGTYVELRRATAVVVGRIIWSAADSCGIHTRETIDVAALRASPHGDAFRIDAERRRIGRPATARPIDPGAFRRLFEASAMLAIAACAAAAIGCAAYGLLARQVSIIETALG